MSNNNQRPWYKDFRIIIPAIVVILAAIIGATWAFWLNPPPSEFGISVNPMKGEVYQGGVITTAITIKGIQGYEHPVSLSASGQPSGIVVTFVPPIGGPTPSYTSSVTINVDSSVPVGDYKIVKKGTGADGKEHSCSYTLTVKPLVKPTATPTATATATPTPPPLAIIITEPSDGDKVSRSIMVKGTIAGEFLDNRYMWVVIHPHVSMGWWPQTGRISPYAGKWFIQAWIGLEEDVGKKFDIAVILVNEDTNQYYQNYLEQGKETGNYPEIPLPEDAGISDLITVTRK